MKKRIVLIFMITISLNSIGQVVSEDILKVIEVFKQGYEQRDTSILNEWFNNIFFDDAEIMGTYAIEPDQKEWDNNKKRNLKTFKSDWVKWGDLTIDLSKVNINYDDNLAWVSFPATITRNPENSSGRTAKESYSNMLKNFEEIIQSNKENLDESIKLHLIAYYANLVMFQYKRGEEYIWPLRISGALQKKNGVWKFRQIHISHPNRGFPNVRL